MPLTPHCRVKLSNCSGSSWRSGAQAPYRSRLGWSAGALDHVLSPHTGGFHLYITGECFAPPFSTKSSHFATALPLLLSPSFLSQNVPQKCTSEASHAHEGEGWVCHRMDGYLIFKCDSRSYTIAESIEVTRPPVSDDDDDEDEDDGGW